jgi:hypothetical protein
MQALKNVPKSTINIRMSPFTYNRPGSWGLLSDVAPEGCWSLRGTERNPKLQTPAQFAFPQKPYQKCFHKFVVLLLGNANGLSSVHFLLFIMHSQPSVVHLLVASV